MAAAERQEVRAVARWVRMSPRKARLVADHIRGRTVPEARTVLAFTSRAAARELEKVLRSAVANAEANHNLVGDQLVVSAAYVDEGPVMKRWRARARGRAAQIRKPTCHITVTLTAPEQAPAPAAPPPAEEEQPKPKASPKPVAKKPVPKKPAAKKPAAEKAAPKRKAPAKKKEASKS
jgi:large subunit ribosomal protein L22